MALIEEWEKSQRRRRKWKEESSKEEEKEGMKMGKKDRKACNIVSNKWTSGGWVDNWTKLRLYRLDYGFMICVFVKLLERELEVKWN